MHAVFDPDDDDISEEITAKVLGVTPGTLKVWRSQGRGPNYRRIGKRVTYTPRSVKAFREAEMREPGSIRRERAERAALLEA